VSALSLHWLPDQIEAQFRAANTGSVPRIRPGAREHLVRRRRLDTASQQHVQRASGHQRNRFAKVIDAPNRKPVLGKIDPNAHNRTTAKSIRTNSRPRDRLALLAGHALPHQLVRNDYSLKSQFSWLQSECCR